MEFDIYAVEPQDKENNYIRSNVWYWRPLWQLVEFICNDLTNEDIEGGGYNDGYIIEKDKSLYIGNKIKNMIESNQFDNYKRQYDEMKNNLPDIPCNSCDGQGNFIDHDCNRCTGSGKVKHFSTNYFLDKNLVIEFYKFSLNSGGFQIC